MVDAAGYIAPSVNVLKDIERLAPQHKAEIDKVINVLNTTAEVIPLLKNFLDELSKLLGK
jgi:uncharacterized protein (UPF0371 family)